MRAPPRSGVVKYPFQQYSGRSACHVLCWHACRCGAPRHAGSCRACHLVEADPKGEDHAHRVGHSCARLAADGGRLARPSENSCMGARAAPSATANHSLRPFGRALGVLARPCAAGVLGSLGADVIAVATGRPLWVCRREALLMSVPGVAAGRCHFRQPPPQQQPAHPSHRRDRFVPTTTLDDHS